MMRQLTPTRRGGLPCDFHPHFSPAFLCASISSSTESQFVKKTVWMATRKRKVEAQAHNEEPVSPSLRAGADDGRSSRRRTRETNSKSTGGLSEEYGRGRSAKNQRTELATDAVEAASVEVDGRLDAVVKRKRQYASTGSGFAVEGRRLLTNAHCIDHHTLVRVRKRGSDWKYLAKVVAVGHECDIAMLVVEDEDFWEGVDPVKLGELPQLRDPVTVIGFPIGGDTMSVSSGVVSRIEVTPYMHGAVELLAVQIDAAINSGNSGGPAFNRQGECVGIAFQSLKHEDAENVGYIIPTPVIRHFIHDYDKNGRYTGFPCLGIQWQRMENPHLRESAKMKPDQKGVLVRRIEPTLPSSKGINEYDILLKFDGVDIANDGTVPFRHGERLNFTYLVSSRYSDDDVGITLLKDGKQVNRKVKLKAPYRLIPVHIRNNPPSYYIIAGLVFTPVTVPYLHSEYGKEYDLDAPVKLVDKLLYGMASTPGEEVVVLGQVLASDINIGYEDITNTQVKSLNGKKVSDLRTLVNLVDGCEEEYLEFELEYMQKVVLKTKEAKESTSSILTLHCIPSDRSKDLIVPDHS